MKNKHRILIVDDEPSICLLVKLTLEETGSYEVKEETDSGRAVATAREFKPDLLLLDVMMPGLDGGDVASLFKEDPNLKRTPIVFVTAALLPGEATAQGGMIGGHPFIAKPLSAEALTEAVERVLRN